MSLIGLLTKFTRLCTLTGCTASSRDFERRRSETQARQVGSLDMELRSHDSRTVSPGSAGDELNLAPACRCVDPVNTSRGPRHRFVPASLALPPSPIFPSGVTGCFPSSRVGKVGLLQGFLFLFVKASVRVCRISTQLDRLRTSGGGPFRADHDLERRHQKLSHSAAPERQRDSHTKERSP